MPLHGWMNGWKTRNRHECRNQISFAHHLCDPIMHSELINENMFECTKIKANCDSKKKRNYATDQLKDKFVSPEQNNNSSISSIDLLPQSSGTTAKWYHKIRIKKKQETNNRFGYRVLRFLFWSNRCCLWSFWQSIGFQNEFKRRSTTIKPMKKWFE